VPSIAADVMSLVHVGRHSVPTGSATARIAVRHAGERISQARCLTSPIGRSGQQLTCGDCCVQKLHALKRKHEFLLLVDDAHGTLTAGVFGGGSDDVGGVSHTADVHVGTLSKAVGAQGGFIACASHIKSVVANAGRAYMYSTALPVPVVAGALAALDVIQRCAASAACPLFSDVRHYIREVYPQSFC
jgi:Aminotransferase class I and II